MYLGSEEGGAGGLLGGGGRRCGRATGRGVEARFGRAKVAEGADRHSAVGPTEEGGDAWPTGGVRQRAVPMRGRGVLRRPQSSGAW